MRRVKVHYDSKHLNSLQLRVHRLDNGSFIATFLNGQQNGQFPSGNTSLDNLFHLNGTQGSLNGDYDDVGALYYVVAVVFIYGFSIILMIGSLIRKSNTDRGMNIYMKGLDKVRRLERRQQKFKVRMFMHNRRVQRMIGGSMNSMRQSVHESMSNEEDTHGTGKMQDLESEQSTSMSKWSLADGISLESSSTSPLLLHPPSDLDPQSAMPSSALSPSAKNIVTKSDVCVEMGTESLGSGSLASDYGPKSAEISTTKMPSPPALIEEFTRAQLATLLEEEEEGTLV